MIPYAFSPDFEAPEPDPEVLEVDPDALEVDLITPEADLDALGPNINIPYLRFYLCFLHCYILYEDVIFFFLSFSLVKSSTVNKRAFFLIVLL